MVYNICEIVYKYSAELSDCISKITVATCYNNKNWNQISNKNMLILITKYFNDIALHDV